MKAWARLTVALLLGDLAIGATVRGAVALAAAALEPAAEPAPVLELHRCNCSVCEPAS